MHANGKTEKLQVPHASASSRHGSRQLLSSMARTGKWMLEHPGITLSIGAGILGVGVAASANAQQKENDLLAANRPGTTEVSEKAAETKAPVPKETMKVTYENGIKIVGDKTFDIQVTKGDVKQIIYTEVKDIGKVAYLVSENKIVRLSPNSSIDTVDMGTVRPTDGSKFFSHEGSIYVTSDGSLAATTPTTIVIIGGSDAYIERKYADRFKGFPPLKRPTLREGNGPDFVDLRDDVIAGSRVQVSVRTGEMDALPDLLGSR